VIAVTVKVQKLKKPMSKAMLAPNCLKNGFRQAKIASDKQKWLKTGSDKSKWPNKSLRQAKVAKTGSDKPKRAATRFLGRIEFSGNVKRQRQESTPGLRQDKTAQTV
jgi:hypothetical protein